MDADFEKSVPPSVRPDPSTAGIAARLERLPFSRYHKRLLVAVSTAYLFESLSVAIMTFILAPISSDLQMSKAEAGVLASATFAGMAIGATTAGLLSDRFGRRPVFAYSMLLWGLASLLSALAWDVPSLMVLRFVTGLGLGAEIPVAMALLAEFLPAVNRGRAMGWMNYGIPLSFVLSGLLALALVPALGWRWMFVVLFVLALGGFYVRRGVPESPRWLASQGRHGEADATLRRIEEAVTRATGRPLPPPTAVLTEPPGKRERQPVRALLSRHQRCNTLVAWGLWFFGLLGYYAITSWIAALLVDKGMSVANSIAFVVAMYVWGIPGVYVCARLMEWIGRKPVVVGVTLLGAAAAYVYASATTATSLLLAGSLLQFFMVGIIASIYTYTPELFPTTARATGTGTANSAGRLSSIIGPLLVPSLLAAWGQTTTFAVLCVFFVVAAIVVIVFGPETKGRALEDITR